MRTFLLSLFIVFITSLHLSAQNVKDCQDCTRFQGFMTEGKAFLEDKKFYEALSKFQAAQVAAKVCKCSSNKPASLIEKAIEGLQQQKIQAENDADEAKRQKEKAEKANNKANRLAKEAQDAARKAEEEATKNARIARSNNNALKALQLSKKDPTQALCLAEMNYQLYPESKSAAGIFAELFKNKEAGLYKKIIKKGHTFSVESVAFAPNGKAILTGSYDNTAILWDLKGNPLQRFSGHTSYVRSVAFAPDGKAILTGSDDNTAILWDLNGNPLQTFLGHTSPVRSVTFTTDGHYVLSASPRNFLSYENGKILKKLTYRTYLEQKVHSFSIWELMALGLEFTDEDLARMEREGKQW